MKRILCRAFSFRTMMLMITLGLCGITSCVVSSPTTPVSAPTSTPLSEPTVNKSTQTQVLALPSSTSTAPPLVGVQPTSTVENLAYDPDANVLLVQAQTFGPPRPPWFKCYVLPELRVWGDGRVVRVMTKGDKREVAVGRLSTDRVRQMLLFLRDQGALSPWPPVGGPPNPGGSGFAFRVQLKAGLVDNSTFPPPAFFPKLLAFFNADEVKPLVPQQAFLIATDGSTSSDKVQEWPTRFNISLAKAMDEGLWISDDALNFLWEDANNALSLHTFRQNGKMYAVALEIAGVGPTEPPTHCWAEWNKLLPRVEEITLDQAKQLAGFHLLEPGYLPAGFHLQRVMHSTTVSTFVDPANYLLPPVTHYFDSVNLEYGGSPPTGRAGSQGFVTIGERFFPDMPLPPGVPPPAATPDLHPETLTVRNARALVNRYSAISPPDWVTPEPGAHAYISLEWHEKDYYFTLGGSLSLEELTRIANSLK
jgi:hypothetical protein